jgi:hypothetical protein
MFQLEYGDSVTGSNRYIFLQTFRNIYNSPSVNINNRNNINSGVKEDNETKCVS